MQATSETASKPFLAVNEERLTELRDAHGITSDAELARRLKVNPATLYRIAKGISRPSNEFMTSLKIAFPMCSLDDILIVTHSTSAEQVAA